MAKCNSCKEIECKEEPGCHFENPIVDPDGCKLSCGEKVCEQVCEPVSPPSKNFCRNGNIVPKYDLNKCIVGYECKLDCSDGTQSETCSENQPKYCDAKGKLINNCHECGCEIGTCNADGRCRERRRWWDIFDEFFD